MCLIHINHIQGITVENGNFNMSCKMQFCPTVFYKVCTRRVGVVIRAFASQSVDLGFIPLVESYQKTLKNGVHSFPAWRLAFSGGCGEQPGKFACCVLGQDT